MRDDRSLHLVEEAQTHDDARARVRALAELWPGEYVIDDEETGERVFVSTREKELTGAEIGRPLPETELQSARYRKLKARKRDRP